MIDVGAGIQPAPNKIRFLDRWSGVGQRVRKAGIVLKDVNILRWQKEQKLATVTVNTSFGDQSVVHCAGLHNALLDEALEMLDVELRLNSIVVSVDTEKATAIPSTRQKVIGDILLEADGIKSLARRSLLADVSDAAIPTGARFFASC